MFFDDNGDERNNTLSLFSQKNSFFYLIVGKKFIENNNLSQLNCSIYVADKSQVSNGGLKSSGEDVLIQNILNDMNETINLSFCLGNDEYEFEEYQSLNYNQSLNKYYISNMSVCDSNYPLVIFQNDTNQSQLEQNMIDFRVEIENFLVFDRVEFDFETKVSNFTIEYWIEDYAGNILKSKRNTTNLNTKSWTPKGITNMFTVKANLYFKNYTISNSSDFFLL